MCLVLLTRDVPDIRFRFRLAGYPAIFSNPVPAPVPDKMVPGTGYLSRIVLSPFVPSEHLFSTAGGVITEHRARLLPDNADRLIFLKYTVSQKKGTPTLSIVTLKRINGFWRFFAQTFLIQLAIKWYFKFQPHPSSVSTLPGENRTNEILHFIQGSIITLLK